MWNFFGKCKGRHLGSQHQKCKILWQCWKLLGSLERFDIAPELSNWCSSCFFPSYLLGQLVNIFQKLPNSKGQRLIAQIKNIRYFKRIIHCFRQCLHLICPSLHDDEDLTRSQSAPTNNKNKWLRSWSLVNGVEKHIEIGPFLHVGTTQKQAFWWNVPSLDKCFRLQTWPNLLQCFNQLHSTVLMRQKSVSYSWPWEPNCVPIILYIIKTAQQC